MSTTQPAAEEHVADDSGAESGADAQHPLPELDGLIEIGDPEVDPGRIMETIRERIRQRRQELGYDGRTFPVFGAAAYPGEPEGVAYDADLYHYLRLANDSFAAVDTEAVLASSPATRVPVLGRIWQLIRGGAHQLVLFYVNRAVTHQTDVNAHLVSVLNRMAAVIEQQERAINQLQAEVKALRRRSE